MEFTKNTFTNAMTKLANRLSRKDDPRFIEIETEWMISKVEDDIPQIKGKIASLIEDLQDTLRDLDHPDRTYFGRMGTRALTADAAEIDEMIAVLRAKRRIIVELGQMARIDDDEKEASE